MEKIQIKTTITAASVTVCLAGLSPREAMAGEAKGRESVADAVYYYDGCSLVEW